MGLRLTLIIFFNVVLVFQSSAQLDISGIVNKYNAYQNALPKTKLHLSLNQSKFIPGDTVYFSAYFLSEDLIGVADKQLLDLHLIDPAGNSIIHYKYAVDNGFGYNQLALPETLSPGVYRIVSYSSWMRNFDDDVIYNREIQIVNDHKLIVNKTPEVGIEGGSLIYHVPNKVVVTGLKNGQNLQLLDEENTVIKKAKANRLGIGSFVFTPLDDNYHIVINDGLNLNLPKPIVDGYSINLNSRNNEALDVRLYTPKESKYINKDLFLVITSRGRILYSAKFNQALSGVTNLSFPKSNFPEGIAHISLLNEYGQMVVERDFYNETTNPLSLDIKLNKSNFQPREKVNFSFKIDNTSEKGIANVMVKVLSMDLFDDAPASLNDELNIFSSIEKDISLDRTDSSWMQTLDNHLIVNNTTIDWDRILSNKTPKPEYAFTSILRKNGIAYINDSTGEFVSAETKIVFYMQNSMWRYETSVLNNGEVWMMIPQHFGEDEILYFAEDYKGKRIEGMTIKWKEEVLKDFEKPLVAQESELNDKYGEFAKKSLFINNSFSFFANNDTTTVSVKNINPNDRFEQRVYGADLNVNVQNYQLFPSMVEMIREIIPSVIHRGKNDSGFVRVTLPQPMDLATDNPLYVVNGIATKDTRYFLSLKASDILKVKVVNNPMKLLPLGLMGKNGIIMIQTKTGEERPPISSDNIVDGLSKRIDFNNLDFAKSNRVNHPYFKSTIYWNPSVKVDDSGAGELEFYLSDDVGKMLIYIEGITNDGVPFSISKYIDVATGY